MEFIEYFNVIIVDCCVNLREDVVIVIVNGEIDGKWLGDFEVSGYYIIVVIVGYDMMFGLMVGGFWVLCENLDEFCKLKENLDFIFSYVDEFICWIMLVKYFMCFVMVDMELCGEKILEGDCFMFCYLLGNCDEEVFEDLFWFFVEWKINKYVVFGYGVYVCLG